MARVCDKPPESRRYESWLWLVLFVVASVPAVISTSFFVGQALEHRSIWYLVDPPSFRGMHIGFDKELLQQLEKDWADVADTFRPSWVLYRTPISLYLATLTTCLGPVCCFSARQKWWEVGWFVALGVATLALAGFHAWAHNRWTQIEHAAMWPIMLFPGSLLVPLRCYIAVVNRLMERVETGHDGDTTSAGSCPPANGAAGPQ